jgi:hypothetical protein
VAVIPDTQFYAEDRSEYAADQTRWIRNNVGSENIAFATHVGDIVENGDVVEEWEHLSAAMDTLDGAVPYSALPGNHDFAETGDRSSGVENYRTYFGPSRYEGYEWFGGTGPEDEETNSYQLFSAGGYQFLHLALEWEPRDDSIEWAQGVVDDYSDLPTIVTTHAYLTDGNGGDGGPGRTMFVQEDDDDGNSGQTLWERLIRPNPQIFMVLNGHFHRKDGEYHQVSENEAGQDVYEMLADYQGRADGGNGWMRLIRFEPGGGEDAPDRIQVETFSPSMPREETDGDSNFAFDLDFASRFEPSSSEPSPTPFPDPDADVWFRQGTDGYDGTVDTNLVESDPESSYATAQTVTVDSSEPQPSDDTASALVRFDGIVGDDDGQIPPNATVSRATLTVQTTDKGSGTAVHRMLTEWTDSNTWASLDGGVRADGTDAVADPDTETGRISTGVTEVDVTASVQAWVDGAPNYGWVLLPLGDDGWDFSTAESDSPPRLSATYEETIAGDVDGDGNVDDDDVESVQRAIANEDVDIDRSAADMDGDGDIDIVDVVRIANERGSR